MPVLDNLKNFIRHGKAARDHENASSTSSPSTKHAALPPSDPSRADPAISHDPASSSSKLETRQPPTERVPSGNKSQAYAKHAEQMVEEERQAKERMPVYEGLEGYQLLEKMGDGAFSNVYKALDLKTNDQVAIKVVRKYELSHTQSNDGKHLDPAFRKKNRVTERANILKEVQIMRGIKNDHIVQLLGFFESPEHYFLILEIMQGGELFHQIVKLTYFSENLARHVILQVANGIRYLHEERGVVHRDIKPENLLFERIPIRPSAQPQSRQYDEEKEDEGIFIPGVGGGGIGRVKIADFGLSKVVWDDSTMTPCGTVGYTAPEIVRDERYSKSVDMWALGCVLYTLLCGFPPFYDESIQVLTEKVAKGYYTFLSPWWDDISASSKDLIANLLCVDTAKRFTIDEFLAHPWCNETSAASGAESVPLHGAVDSPLLQAVKGTGRQPLPSPGVHQLKEAFDVTYAVHRMEEEGARRRAYNGPGGAGQAGFLAGLNEEDDDEDEDMQIEETRRKYGAEVSHAIEQQRLKALAAQANAANVDQATLAAQHRAQQKAAQQYQGRGGADKNLAEAMLYGGGRAGQRDRGTRDRKKGFELNIGNSTLLGRRQNHPGGLGLQMAMPPGSPMRVD